MQRSDNEIIADMRIVIHRFRLADDRDFLLYVFNEQRNGRFDAERIANACKMNCVDFLNWLNRKRQELGSLRTAHELIQDLEYDPEREERKKAYERYEREIKKKMELEKLQASERRPRFVTDPDGVTMDMKGKSERSKPITHDPVEQIENNSRSKIKIDRSSFQSNIVEPGERFCNYLTLSGGMDGFIEHHSFCESDDDDYLYEGSTDKVEYFSISPEIQDVYIRANLYGLQIKNRFV